MPRISAIRRAKKAICEAFDAMPRKVFTHTELRDILNHHRRTWRLPEYLGITKFTEFLLQEGKLKTQYLRSEKYRHRTLYAWGQPSDFQIAAAIRSNAYLSHWTAVFLHGLTDQVPQTIYVNKEQSEKPKAPPGSLTQEAITRAFKNSPRTSNYIFQLGKRRVCLLSGKQTKGLEVGEVVGPTSEVLPCTKLERTLIDIAVRPQYAGGVYQVLSAFEAAKSKASSNVLLATLRKLDYTYPYHQVVGFYLWKAGYPKHGVDLFRQQKMDYDFYLANRIPEKRYVKKWRLFVPKGLEEVD